MLTLAFENYTTARNENQCQRDRTCKEQAPFRFFISHANIMFYLLLLLLLLLLLPPLQRDHFIWKPFLSLPAGTSSRVWAVAVVRYVNTTNRPTDSDNRQLSHKIMATYYSVTFSRTCGKIPQLNFFKYHNGIFPHIMALLHGPTVRPQPRLIVRTVCGHKGRIIRKVCRRLARRLVWLSYSYLKTSQSESCDKRVL